MVTLALLSTIYSALAQHISPTLFEETYHLGEVTDIGEPEQSEIIGDGSEVRKINLKIISGEEEGKLIESEITDSPNLADDQKVKIGDTVVIQKSEGFGTSLYSLADKYRLNSLWILLATFLGIIFALTGKRGITSLIGLAFSILVIVSFVIPQIIAGRNPLLITLLAGLVITTVSIYFAHGFTRRTTIALISTLITLVIAILLAVTFVALTNLSGTGSEEAFFLQFTDLGSVNLRGLLLSGIIIGTLGVLDDVTTAQSAAVDELKKANHTLSFAELYRRGISIGKEHITSLVNTLALAYAGASLPILLSFTIVDQPLWVLINSEFIMEEIVRTLVGSISLILAVPITTGIAAWYFSSHTRLRS